MELYLVTMWGTSMLTPPFHSSTRQSDHHSLYTRYSRPYRRVMIFFYQEFYFIITGLSQYTKYSIIVQAFNNVGTGPENVPQVVATTDEDGQYTNYILKLHVHTSPVPSVPPCSVSCSSSSSTSLLITWAPPDTRYINGVLQGFSVVYKPMLEWEGII